jgi:hypothetical protein
MFREMGCRRSEHSGGVIQCPPDSRDLPLLKQEGTGGWSIDQSVYICKYWRRKMEEVGAEQRSAHDTPECVDVYILDQEVGAQ